MKRKDVLGDSSKLDVPAGKSQTLKQLCQFHVLIYSNYIINLNAQIYANYRIKYKVIYIVNRHNLKTKTKKALEFAQLNLNGGYKMVNTFHKWMSLFSLMFSLQC